MRTVNGMNIWHYRLWRLYRNFDTGTAILWLFALVLGVPVFCMLSLIVWMEFIMILRMAF